MEISSTHTITWLDLCQQQFRNAGASIPPPPPDPHSGEKSTPEKSLRGWCSATIPLPSALRQSHPEMGVLHGAPELPRWGRWLTRPCLSAAFPSLLPDQHSLPYLVNCSTHSPTLGSTSGRPRIETVFYSLCLTI